MGTDTRKGDDRLYLIMYGKPESGKIELPCTFDKGKVKASMLHGNKAVRWNRMPNVICAS